MSDSKLPELISRLPARLGVLTTPYDCSGGLGRIGILGDFNICQRRNNVNLTLQGHSTGNRFFIFAIFIIFVLHWDVMDQDFSVYFDIMLDQAEDIYSQVGPANSLPASDQYASSILLAD